MSYLIDTNVLSEAMRPRPSRRVLDWLEGHETMSFVSVLTLGEIQRGLSLHPNGRKQRGLESWFERLRLQFSGRILPLDDRVAVCWGRYQARFQGEGRTVPVSDSLIAATALVHDLTVATRNVDDLPGVRTLNPWKD